MQIPGQNAILIAVKTVQLRPMAHDPSSPSKLLVPEFRTSNFANSVMHSGTRFVW